MPEAEPSLSQLLAPAQAPRIKFTYHTQRKYCKSPISQTEEASRHLRATQEVRCPTFLTRQREPCSHLLQHQHKIRFPEDHGENLPHSAQAFPISRSNCFFRATVNPSLE